MKNNETPKKPQGEKHSPDPVHPRHLSLDERLGRLVEQAEADRDSTAQLNARVDKLLEAVNNDRDNNEGHRDNLARALEDEFIASLPRVMKAAHGIVIKPEDIRVREKLHSPNGDAEGEVDFIAPNGELVLAGEVKTRLTTDKVDAFFARLDCDFRGWFPEYAGRPVIGVVAGARIDPPAAARARKRGFVILRLDGAGAHPATVRGARGHALKKF